MSAIVPAPDSIPESLRARDQWICWREQDRDGKPTKVPVEPTDGSYASATDPETWHSFETAHEFVQDADVAGLGYVFIEDGPFVGVDLDDCRDPTTGDVSEWAASIIHRLDSYTEVSPSGTGFHVLVEGSLPQGRNRKGDVELYETARFFTVTGDRYRDAGIEQRSEELAAVHSEHVAATEQTTHQTSVRDHTDDNETGRSHTLSDDALLTRAREAKNGEKFTRLWCGDTTGYDSQSEADMALCTLLAFWTGGDATRMDRLFRDSELIREKWDTQHFADGSTYGEKTIERAIGHVDEFYDPGAGQDHERSNGQREARDEAGATPTTSQTETGAAAPSSRSPTNDATDSTSAPTTSNDSNERAMAARVDSLELEIKRLRSTLEQERAHRESLEERVTTLEAVVDEAADASTTSDDSMVDRLGSLFD